MIDYILFVRTIDGNGEHLIRFWDRASRMWIESFVNAQGYATASAAQARLTTCEKRGWKLPKDWTLYEWGWQSRTVPLV